MKNSPMKSSLYPTQLQGLTPPSGAENTQKDACVAPTSVGSGNCHAVHSSPLLVNHSSLTLGTQLAQHKAEKEFWSPCHREP